MRQHLECLIDTIMKIKETISEPATFIKKEVRRILINDIRKPDLPELGYALANLLAPGLRRNCILWLCIETKDFWIKNERDAEMLTKGFLAAMELVDPTYQKRVEALPPDRSLLYLRPNGFLGDP